MNRRDFLRSLIAAPLAPVLTRLPIPTPSARLSSIAILDLLPSTEWSGREYVFEGLDSLINPGCIQYHAGSLSMLENEVDDLEYNPVQWDEIDPTALVSNLESGAGSDGDGGWGSWSAGAGGFIFR